MAKRCTICGKKFTFFNHSLGSNECKKCAAGKTPEAVAKNIEKIFDGQEFDPQEVLERPVTEGLSRIVVGIILGNIAFFIALLISIYLLKTQNPGIQWVAFAGTLWLYWKAVFKDSVPLSKERWSIFVAGEFICYMATILPLNAYYGPELVEYTIDSTVMSTGFSSNFFPRLFGIYMAACLAGLIGGVALLKVADRSTKRKLLRMHEHYVSMRKSEPGQQTPSGAS